MEVPYTKNGRCFPITETIRGHLEEIRTKQEKLCVRSDYIICRKSGERILKRHLERRIRRCCKRLGYSISNNHAFRMSLNSYVLIPLDIPVTQRAYLFGHSPEINLKYYTHARTDSLKDIKKIIDMGSGNGVNSVIHTSFTQKLSIFRLARSTMMNQ